MEIGLSEPRSFIWRNGGPVYLSAAEYLYLTFDYRPFPPDDPVRDLLEQAIERNLHCGDVDRYIAFLDALDGDADVELNVSNAYNDPKFEECEATLVSAQGGVVWDDGDCEGSLGSLDGIDQSHWSSRTPDYFDLDIELDLSEAVSGPIPRPASESGRPHR